MDTPKENALCGACSNLIIEPSSVEAVKMSGHGFFNCKLHDLSSFSARGATCTFYPVRFIPIQLEATK
jgi:hypothetical protein